MKMENSCVEVAAASLSGQARTAQGVEEVRVFALSRPRPAPPRPARVVEGRGGAGRASRLVGCVSLWVIIYFAVARRLDGHVQDV